MFMRYNRIIEVALYRYLMRVRATSSP